MARIALRLFPVATLIVAFALPTTAMSAEPQECTVDSPCLVRVRTVAPKNSAWGKLLTLLAKEVKADSAGRLKLKVYWQSKSEPSAVRQCLRGKIGGIGVSTGALASAIPEMMATEMPYNFSNYAEVDKALEAAKPLIKEIMKKAGFIYGVRGANGFRNFATKDAFLLAPEQLKGRTMRSQPAKHHLTMYKELGATPMPIQVADVAQALANGSVGGYDNTLLYADLANWADEIKYVTISKHIYQAAYIAWCGDFFGSLPADLQSVLTKDRPKLEELGLKLVRHFNDSKVPKRYKEKGIQMKEHSAAQRAAFKAATAGVEKAFRAETTADGRALLDLLQK